MSDTRVSRAANPRRGVIPGARVGNSRWRASRPPPTGRRPAASLVPARRSIRTTAPPPCSDACGETGHALEEEQPCPASRPSARSTATPCCSCWWVLPLGSPVTSCCWPSSAVGVIPAVANTVQAVLTLQLNFVGQLLAHLAAADLGVRAVPVRCAGCGSRSRGWPACCCRWRMFPRPRTGHRHIAGVLVAARGRRGRELLPRQVLVVPAGPQTPRARRRRPRPAGRPALGRRGHRRDGGRRVRAGSDVAGRLPRRGVRVHGRRSDARRWSSSSTSGGVRSTTTRTGTARRARRELPGAILVPMRDEDAVAGPTLRRLSNLDHPRYWVVPIVDHEDDMATARIAHAAARQNPERVRGLPVPGGHRVPQQADRAEPRGPDAARPGASRTSGWGSPTPRTCSIQTCCGWSTTGSGRPAPGSCSAASS